MKSALQQPPVKKSFASSVLSASLVASLLVATPLAPPSSSWAAHASAEAAVQKTSAPPRQEPTPTPRKRQRIGVAQTPTPTPTPQRRPRDPRQSSDDGQRPTPTPTPRPGGSNTGRNAAIIGGIAGAAILGGVLASRGGDSLSKDLDKKGPQFPQSFDMSNFQVQGFARGDWPVVVAYELAEPAVVTLTISAEKVAPFTLRLDGSPGVHEEVIPRLPAQFSDKPRPATYSLTAESVGPGAVQPVPLQLLGLGAGHNAVGSVGIDRVNFQPGRVDATNQSQRADYSFHSLFDFNKVNVEFRRITRGPQRQIIAERVSGMDFKNGISRDAELGGQWDCRASKRVSVGLHQLQVRAWRGLKKGGDWVAAISPQSIFVD